MGQQHPMLSADLAIADGIRFLVKHHIQLILIIDEANHLLASLSLLDALCGVWAQGVLRDNSFTVAPLRHTGMATVRG